MTAKKKNMSKKLGRKRGFIEFAKKHKIICFVLVLVFLFFGFRFGSVYLEKRDLEAKRVQLEQIADDIAAKFPPSERKSEQYCKYSNQKLNKGSLSCSVATLYSLDNPDFLIINKIIDDIELSQKTSFVIGNTSSKKIVKISGDQVYTDQDYVWAKILDSEKCSATVRFINKGDIASKGMVLLECYTSPSKSEHYIVKDNL